METGKEIPVYLAHIFNEVQAEMIHKNIGRHLHFLRRFTQSVIQAPAPPNLVDMVKLPLSAWQEEYTAFLHKICKLYVHPLVAHMLEQGDLDYAVTARVDSRLLPKHASLSGPNH